MYSNTIMCASVRSIYIHNVQKQVPFLVKKDFIFTYEGRRCVMLRDFSKLLHIERAIGFLNKSRRVSYLNIYMLFTGDIIPGIPA